MEFVLIVAGAVALVLLWQRVNRLEGELRELRLSLSSVHHRQAQSEPAVVTPPLPQRRSATVLPKIAGNASPLQAPPAQVPDVKAGAEPEMGRKGFAFDFEEVFGRQLPIWAGGITLAVAGFFLVRYAIDVGLLSPAVRVAMGLVFGLGLIAGAEAAHRFKDRVADVRVPQALSGAGLAVLYASVFLAGTFYGLIGTGTAFVGLALVTAAAIALSFRFGLPSAVLGLVGGFAAPALVGAQETNLPLLAFYLALVAGGLGHAGRKRAALADGGGWAHGGWLGLAGIVGGLGWGLVMLIAQPSGPGDVVAVGFYLVVLGAVLPSLALPDLRESRWLRLAAGGFASLQMGALLETSGYEPLSWGLYLLLGAAFAGLGWKNAGLRDASAIGGGVGAWMLGFWYAPDPVLFAAVGAAMAAVFAGVPLAHLWQRDARGPDIAALAVMPLAIALAAIWHFGDGVGARGVMLGLAALALAALPALGAWRLGAGAGWRSAVLEASIVLTAYAGLAQIVPDEWLAWIAGGAATALAFGLSERRWAALAAAGVALAWALWPLGWWMGASADTLVGAPGYVGDFPPPRDALLYLVPVAFAALAVSWRTERVPAWIAQSLALIPGIAALHIAFKQVFDIRVWDRFVALGLAERSAWEALLLAGGAGAYLLRRQWAPSRHAATALAAASLAHFAFYTGLLHNPLWSEQSVGPAPIANLLIVAYGVGGAALLLLGQSITLADNLQRPVRIALDVILMVLVSLFALSELRQFFAGTNLAETQVGQAEDLLRSLLGILLAGAFLLWGARTGTRSWRIGSLVLMLIAVCKVFIYDTAGLEGLVRIASFLALGFSLIAIGWFYSRLLRGPDAGKGKAGTVTPASPPDPVADAPGSIVPS